MHCFVRYMIAQPVCCSVHSTSNLDQNIRSLLPMVYFTCDTVMSSLRVALLLFISQTLAQFTTTAASKHVISDLTPPVTEEFLLPFRPGYQVVPNSFSSEHRDLNLDPVNLQMHQAVGVVMCAKDTHTVYCTAGSQCEKPEGCVCPGCCPDGATRTSCPPTTVMLDAMGRRTICRTVVTELTLLHSTRQPCVRATTSAVSKSNGDLDILSDLEPLQHKITAFPAPTGTSRQWHFPEEVKAGLSLFSGVGQACGSGGFECIKGTNTVCCASGQACNPYGDCLCPGCCASGASCTGCPPTTVFTVPAGYQQTTCKTVPAPAFGTPTPLGQPGQVALQRGIVKPFAYVSRVLSWISVRVVHALPIGTRGRSTVDRVEGDASISTETAQPETESVLSSSTAHYENTNKHAQGKGARAIGGHKHAHEHLHRRNDTASSSNVANRSSGSVLPTLWFTTTTTSTVTVSVTDVPLATEAAQVCNLRRKRRA
jgi:hypothetical protein